MSSEHLDMERLEAACRKAGLPVTIQRRVIFEALAHRHDHPTADTVYEEVIHRIPGVSRATVYRTLDTLVELGVARRISHIGRAVRYDPHVDTHHHVYCISCDRVIDVDEPALDHLAVGPDKLQGFALLSHSVMFEGLCPACQKQQETVAS